MLAVSASTPAAVSALRADAPADLITARTVRRMHVCTVTGVLDRPSATTLEMLSDAITASDTQITQLRPPVVSSSGSPVAQPMACASGESTAQPTSAPNVMLTDVGRPMIMPCPM